MAQRETAALTGAASGAATGATVGSVFPGPGTVIGAGVGGIIGGAAGYFGSKPASKPRRRKAYTLTPEQIGAYAPVTGNIPGYAAEAFQPITVGKGTRRQQQADEQAQIARAISRRASAENAARFNAAYGQLTEQQAAADQYGTASAAELDRLGIQRGAQARQNAIRRGYGNSTVANSLQRGAEAQTDQQKQQLQQYLLGYRNNVRDKFVNLYGQPQNVPLSLPDQFQLERARYGIADSEQSARNAQAASQQQQQTDLFSNLAGSAIQGYASRPRGGYSPFSPATPYSSAPTFDVATPRTSMFG